MIQRKKEREILKQFTVVTKKTRTLKVQSKRTSTGPSNSNKQFVNLIFKVIKTTKELQVIPLHSIITGSCLITDVKDLTVTETLNTNRHDRRVVLSQRFRE